MLSLALTLALSGLAAEPPRAAVDAVLDDWHAAAAKADEKRYFGHFTPDAVFLGTDASERWTKERFHAYARPHFAKGKAWTLRPRDRFVMFSPDGAAAWFDEKVDSPKYGEGRGTGVLLRTKDGWKIAHYNYTVPIPNDKLLDVLELIRPPRPKP